LSTSTYRICLQCGTQYGVEQRNCPTDGSALQLKTSDDPLLGKVIADRYHIMELLGVGGMGRVYLAEHVALGRKSAVKVIHPTLSNSAEAISRFNREAANASRINHPNIAQIYDFGESDGVLYLAMEYIEGEALATVIERLGPMSTQRAAGIVTQVADALSAAHMLGIVHRDLKPENIMIGRKHDGADWVKVVDFGIAKTMESEQGGGSQNLTTVGVSLGTPEYMSPEQFAGEKLDHRTDIYSLALVLFNMLTGQLPYPKVTSKETLVKRLTTQPAPLATVRPDTPWPPGLQTALDRALAPDATERYSRATDFAADVQRASERNAQVLQRVMVGAITPVGTPAQPMPTKRPAPPKRQPVWPIFAWLLLLGLFGGAYVNAQRIERLIGMLPPAGKDTTALVAPVVPVDSVPQVAVIPQGETSADSSALTLPGGLPQQPGKGPLAKPGSTTTTPPPRDSSAGTAVATTPSAATHAPPPPVHNDSQPQGPSLLRHPWLRANGDSGAARRVDEGIGDEDLHRMQIEELQGHLALAHRFAARGDVAQARAAFRDASDEARGLKLADRSLAGRIDFLLRNAMGEVMRACQSAHADTLNPFAAQVDCGALFAF
jgi:protein kinase-like protein